MTPVNDTPPIFSDSDQKPSPLPGSYNADLPIVVHCLPLHRTLIFGGPLVGLLLGILNVEFGWSLYLTKQSAPLTISTYVFLGIVLSAWMTALAVFISHGGNHIHRIEASEAGLVFNGHNLTHDSRYMDLYWSDIDDIRYYRWGITIQHHNDELPRSIRMSPIHPMQAEELMRYCHLVLHTGEDIPAAHKLYSIRALLFKKRNVWQSETPDSKDSPIN